MTTTIGRAITAKLIGLMIGDRGVNSRVAEFPPAIRMPLARLNVAQVRAQNVATDIAERSNTVQYPAVNVYCEKVVNSLAEKFRAFSGSAQMVIELRHSLDRIDGLQDSLEAYADAVMQVLNTNRGDWGDGMFYAGEYQAIFGAVKHGGKNFIQVVKITFEIGVSRS
jgi:hypothetical protein